MPQSREDKKLELQDLRNHVGLMITVLQTHNVSIKLLAERLAKLESGFADLMNAMPFDQTEETTPTEESEHTHGN